VTIWRARKLTEMPYDGLAWLYRLDFPTEMFLRGLKPLRDAQAAEMGPGDLVLYPGAGTSQDVVLAARKGARVTSVELSPKMMELARRLLSRHRVEVELIQGDVFDHQRLGHYDFVVVNMFLCLFSAEVMRDVLLHFMSLLKPGGKLLIADYGPPRGSALARAFHFNMLRIVAVVHRWFSLADWHPSVEAAKVAKSAGIELRETGSARLLKVGPTAYVSYEAIKA